MLLERFSCSSDMGKSTYVGAVINCSDFINKRRKRRMYRSARFKVSVAKIWVLLMFCMFTYVLVGDQVQVSSRGKSVEINVPREWLEHFRQERSLLLNNVSLPSQTSANALMDAKKAINSRLKLSTENVVITPQTPQSFQDNVSPYPTDDEIIASALSTFPQEPPNNEFIFHNKLPKSGSTTMNNIFKVLRRKNKFNFLKVDSAVTPFHDDDGFVEFVKDKISPPYLLLKHHYWMNFTRFDVKQPTYINVIRHPLDWFTSHYYFHRYGWKRKPGCRVQRCGMSAQDFNMTIDECVQKRHRQCITPWMYIPFFCGSEKRCVEINNAEQKRQSLQIAKLRMAKDYYLVGILEQFEDTLKVFEKMLPSYFSGSIDAWNGEFVQVKQNQSRTVYKQEMSAESRRFFTNGPLKYEIELYEFAKKLFTAKLQKLGISSTNETSDIS